MAAQELEEIERIAANIKREMEFMISNFKSTVATEFNELIAFKKSYETKHSSMYVKREAPSVSDSCSDYTVGNDDECNASEKSKESTAAETHAKWLLFGDEWQALIETKSKAAILRRKIQ